MRESDEHETDDCLYIAYLVLKLRCFKQLPTLPALAVHLNALVLYTQTVTSNFLHSIYYALLLHVSATRHLLLQKFTSFFDVNSVSCY